eukprot:COSAG01_NODE_3847_length_5644_cov_25.352209_7_plen_151_part_00
MPASYLDLASLVRQQRSADQGVRVRVEIMGSQNCRIVGKSQSVLIMISPIIFTGTRDTPGRYCQTSYSEGVARAPSIWGPYEKMPVALLSTGLTGYTNGQKQVGSAALSTCLSCEKTASRFARAPTRLQRRPCSPGTTCRQRNSYGCGWR